MFKSLGIILSLFLSSITYASFFPKDYESSKQRFLESSRQVANIYKNVVMGTINVGEEKLTINYLFVPAKVTQEKVIVITSGNHGPEAYAGAALQHQFFNKSMASVDHDKTAYLLIHALNPWGFKYHRRGTENNVNLNRNFDISSKIFQTPNEGYIKLKDLLERRVPLKKFEYAFLPLLKKMMFEKGVSQQSLTEAIGRGQYTSARGINFGGKNFESQTLEVIDLLKRYVSQYNEVFHIDLHTGLGDKGILHIMNPPKMNKVSEKRLYSIFKKTDAKDLYEITPPGAKGFYTILGDYKDIISKIHPNKNAVIIGITAEFGTVGRGLLGKLKTVNRLILENQGHFVGYANDKIKAEVQKDYLELFYPDDNEWKNNVLTKGHFLLDTVVRRFIDI